MIADKTHMGQKLKYPKSVFFIISNEFCERFSFYGIRTILMMYLRDILFYDEKTSTVIYHIFTMFVYFFPLFGAILADSWLGKFRTIFYVSVVYAIGQVLLSLSAASVIKLPSREFSLIGLFLIAIGTGGIKPCVSAFGGDQFVLPQQEKYLATFFSIFYFSINAGSTISSFLTPWIRSNVKCFEQNTCYFLAFLIPAILMILSIVIFVTGKSMYKIVKPTGNVIVKVSKCVSHAIYNKVKRKGRKCDHWLDHADDTYDTKLIEDIKATLRVLKLFIPLPVFWALYDQQGSRWTIQATQVDGQIGSFLMQPDQLQAINPVLILIFIPIFEGIIYPLFAKIHFIDTPLKKLTVGGLLASLSFIASGIVELEIEKTYPILPSAGSAQIRIFNTLNCPVTIDMDNRHFTVNPLSMWADLNVMINGSKMEFYKADLTKCYGANVQFPEGDITVHEATASSWVITLKGLDDYEDDVNNPRNNVPLIRGLIYLSPELKKNSTLRFVRDNKAALSISFDSTEFSPSQLKELPPNTYDIYLDDQKLQSEVSFKRGGVYTVVGSNVLTAGEMHIAGRTIMITPNSIHMMWMLLQYIIITMGEVMFSVTGLQFAFTQAPVSMKSLLQAGWLMTVAFGNLLTAIISEISFFSRQANEAFLYAGLMAVDAIIFAIMAKFYKYVDLSEEENIDEDIPLEGKEGKKEGNINPAYREDEK